MEDSKKYALFWGCTIQIRLPWIEAAARKVLPRLGVEIMDLPFSCCPDPVASKSLDHRTWLSLAARNLVLAEEKELDILTMCSGCFETLKMAQHELKDQKTRENINRILKNAKRKYNGTIKVFHFMQWLYDVLELEKLSQFVTSPLSMRVASHVGCHFTRPSDVLQTDNPVYPEKLDELCEILGMEAVDYPDKNLCCGVGVSLVDGQISGGLVQRKIEGAHRSKVDALIAVCPSCIQSYDGGQMILHRKQKVSNPMIPVFHYLEMLGLAMGMKQEEFDFDEHVVNDNINY